MNTLKQITMFGLAIALSGCSSWYLSRVEPLQYRVSDTLSHAELHALIAPYKAHTDSLMNGIVGELPFDLEKARPNGNLGLWMADACRNQAEKKLGYEVDLALLNYGGTRRPYLQKGPVSLGMMYEVMPFENQMVVLKMKGDLLYEILAHAAQEGGEPISSGTLVSVDSDKIRVTVQGEAVLNGREYTLVTNDYMYNGGDGYDMMKKALGIEYLGSLRDALIDEMKMGSLFPEGLTIRWEGLND
ncbi:MAG: hypothetical protein GC180_01705 [Bacteroidetes bacterium]|nr:hypothetical protein [Bacteroidota bacterium]